MKTNEKIIVALVIGIALIGLCGAASAWSDYALEKYPNLGLSQSYWSTTPQAASQSEGGYMQMGYSCTYNDETTSGALTDDIPPYNIVGYIPFSGGTFSYSAFSYMWP